MKDSVILITGASSGIGAGIAAYLSQEHRVIGTSRSAQPEGAFPWMQLDVTDPHSISQCVREIVNSYGRLDVLINNAGLGMVSSFEEAPRENVERLMNTNFYGAFWLIQEVLPIMRNQQSGKIINISSIAGLMGLPYRSVYSASKFAMEGFTEALRTEVGKFGIQACTLQPGSIRTDIKGNRVSHLPKDSPYNPELQHVEDIINTEVDAGIDVQEVAKAISKLISKRKIPSKYVVAKPFQKLVATPIRRLLPSSIFQRLLENHYSIKS